MLTEWLAILGAFFLGLGVIFVRKGLVESSYFSAAVINTSIGTIVFWVLSLLPFASISDVNTMGIAFFVLAGLFVPGFMWLAYNKGVELLGASSNASIFAVYPLFSSLLAVFTLSERPTLGIWVGMIFIICGVVLIERDVHDPSFESEKPTRVRLAFPLLSALLAGFGLVLRKMGLNVYNQPIVGVAVAYLSALCLYTLLSALSTTIRRSLSVNRRSLELFWKAGLSICVGHLCLIYALRYGEVSLVTPLMNVQPFFVFILAHTLLGGLEKITKKLVIGTLVIFIGVTLVTIL